MRRWPLLRWFSPGFGLGLLSCLGSPGHCGGLEIGDELIFVSNDSLGSPSEGCTPEDLGFYPGQEIRLQVAGFPDRKFRGNPCRSALGPMLTATDWTYRHDPDVGDAGRLFFAVMDSTRGSCRGNLTVTLTGEAADESPGEAYVFLLYEPTLAPAAGCPTRCGGMIPGTVRKVPKE